MKLLWIPADLPRFPVTDKLLALTKTEQFSSWEFVRLTEKRASPYDETNWKASTYVDFPEIIEWFECLPIKSLRNVKFNMQHSIVDPHIDFTCPDANAELWKNNSANDPCGYRILIHGNTTNTLYVTDSSGKNIYCNIPLDTNTYILRHSDGVHGVDNDIGRLVIFVHIEIDEAKHSSILASSLVKYGSYAIYDID